MIGHPDTNPSSSSCSDPTVSEILERAADLIEPEGRWMQKDFAANEAGEYCYGDDPGAVCWCARGAIQAVLGTNEFGAPDAAEGYLERLVENIARWNDTPERTQAEVVAALRQAAAVARAEEADGRLATNGDSGLPQNPSPQGQT